MVIDKRFMSEKDKLRAWALRTARLIPEQRRAESDFAAMEQLLAFKEFKEAKTVFCYVSVGEEVSSRAIIEAAIHLKKIVCVPRCLPVNTMETVEICTLS